MWTRRIKQYIYIKNTSAFVIDPCRAGGGQHHHFRGLKPQPGVQAGSMPSPKQGSHNSPPLYRT